MAPAYTDKELKLLRLMMNAGAAKGEIENAAVMLALSLRSRGVSAEDIETATQSSKTVIQKPIKYSRPDYGHCTMPWGKHKGEQFMDIPGSYLRWAVNWIREDDDRSKKMNNLAESLECFLAQ